MSVVFYDVKKREKISVQENDLKKTKYKRKLKDGRVQIRYALRAKTKDDRSLTKFCSKVDWDKLNVPVEK
jgi:hypothetical protein